MFWKSFLHFSPSQSNRSEKSLKEIMILRKAVSKYSQIKLYTQQNEIKIVAVSTLSSYAQ